MAKSTFEIKITPKMLQDAMKSAVKIWSKSNKEKINDSRYLLNAYVFADTQMAQDIAVEMMKYNKGLSFNG